MLVAGEPEPVDGVDDDRHPGPPGGPAPEDAGFGAVRMDDQGAEASEKQGQRKERTEVRDGADRALQRRDLVEFDTGERPRLLIQEARFTRDEQGTEPRGVEVGHREQSILLRASQLQFGDDVRVRGWRRRHLRLGPSGVPPTVSPGRLHPPWSYAPTGHIGRWNESPAYPIRPGWSAGRGPGAGRRAHRRSGCHGHP